MAGKSDGITITFDADTQAAFAKIQDFVAKVNGKVNEVKDNANAQQPEGGGGIFGSLFEVTKAGEFIAGIGAAAAALITIEKIWEGIKEGVRGYIDNVREAITRADEMGRAAEALGVSLQTLNALKILGEQNRVPLEAMEQAIFLMNQRMGEAGRRGGDLLKVWTDWGIKIFQANGALIQGEAALRKVMDRMKELGPQQAAAFVRDVMGVRGPQGRELAEVLGKGSGALDDAAKKDGGIDPVAAENAKEFDQSLVQLHQTFESIWNDVAAQILPVLKDFADLLNKLASNETVHREVVLVLVTAFDIFASVVASAIYYVSNLAVLISGGWNASAAILHDGITAIVTIFHAWLETIASDIKALIDLGSTAAKVGDVLKEAAHGHFSKAWDEAKEAFAGINKDIGALVDSQKSMFKTSAGAMGQFFTGALGHVSDEGGKLLDRLKSNTADFAKIWNSIWEGPEKSAPLPLPDKSKLPIPDSDEAKKVAEQIRKEWEKTTKSQLDLLQIEFDEQKKTLDKEEHNQQTHDDLLLKMEQTLQAKKLQVIAKAQDEANGIALAKLKNAQAAVTGNTDLSEVEKTRQLIPLLQQELALDEQQLAVLEQRKSNPWTNAEARLNAEKQYIALQGQEAALTRQIEDSKSGLTWAGQFQTAIVNLKNQFNVLNQAGQSFQTIFTNAFQSISTNITGVIEKTETWRQGLRNIVSSIVGSVISAIVQMGATWVAQQLLMLIAGQTAGQAAAAANTALSAEEAAIWATPATLATIATEGEASAQAPGLMAAALAAGQGLAFAAEGGLISGPTLLLAGEAGPEFMIRNEAYRYYGDNIMRAFNERRIPKSPSAAGQPSGSGAGASAASSTTVQGHQLSVAFLSTKNQVKEFLSSAEGKGHIVKIARENRYKIGIPT